MKILLLSVFLLTISCSGGNSQKIDSDEFTEPDTDEKMTDMDEGLTDTDEKMTDMDEGLTDRDEERTDLDEGQPDTDERQIDEGQIDEDEIDDMDFDTEPVVFTECMNYSRPVSSAVLKNDDLKEISGMVVSYRNPGLIWVHNDSGGEPALFAIGFDGTIAAKLTLEGLTNIDWEALALAPCGTSDCLYIGDTGDNSLVRNNYSIIKVEEPIITASGTIQEIVSTDWWVYPISYEDGSKNSEAFAIDADGAFYIFTKQIGSTDVYKVDTLFEEDNVFKKIGSINTGIQVPGYPDEAQPSLVTGADINRNGTRLLLRTYGIYTTDDDGIREFAFTKGSFEEIFTFSPIMVPEGKDMQGETVGYNPFSGGYVHISEFYHKVVDFDQNIWVVDCND